MKWIIVLLMLGFASTVYANHQACIAQCQMDFGPMVDQQCVADSYAQFALDVEACNAMFEPNTPEHQACTMEAFQANQDRLRACVTFDRQAFVACVRSCF